jgi:hypothetical protein
MREQESIDDRIRELHCRIALRLDRDPEATLSVARSNLARFRDVLGDRRAFREWASILADGTKAVRRVLVESSDRAVWLRSTSPFIGIIPPSERDRIMSPRRAVRSVDPLDLA